LSAVREGLRSEFWLAAACCRRPLSDRHAAAIRAETDAVDWDRFVRVVKRHQLGGLVHDALRQTAIAIPDRIETDLRGMARQIALDNLRATSEALRLQKMLKDAGIEPSVLKGAPLGMLAYGTIALRQSLDLDIIVPKEMLHRAVGLLEEAGYRRVDPPSSAGDAILRSRLELHSSIGLKDRSGLLVELHWRLCPNPYLLHGISATPPRRFVPVSHDASLGTLEEEDLFAYLCAHGAGHAWWRLKWLADIAALLAAKSEDDVVRLYRAAGERGAGNCAGQALLLCRRLFGTALRRDLEAELIQDARIARLESLALSAMAAGGGETELVDSRFGTTRVTINGFLLGRGWRYRLFEIKRMLWKESDMIELRLPASLSFLYPLARFPLWLRRHLSSRPAQR
jgi:hypothetical protein